MAETKAPNTSAEQLITDHLDIWTTAIDQKSSAGRGSSKKFSLHGIKKLRELILELAVRGKLVPQDPNDEPASVLLERIAAEKAQLVKDKKIKKPKALPEISEDEKPFELPKGWEWARLENTGIGSTGKTPSTRNPDYFNGDIPFIGPGQITTTGTILQADKFLSIDGLSNSSEAGIGDIFMVCIGGSIGKAALVVERVGFNQQINCISPIHMASEYLYLALSSPNFYKAILEKATGSATPIINRGKWEELLVPTPPLEEQSRIAVKVDELMGLCDALEAQTENSITAHQTLVEVLLEALLKAPEQGSTPEQATAQFQQNWQRLSEHFDTLFTTTASIDTLKQTILQLAVMGKLVPQNPNDEPAAKLLERIAAEKAQLIKDKKIKKQKPLPEITDEEKPFELPNGWEWCRLQDSIDVRDGTHDSPKDANGGETYPLVTSKDFKDGSINFKSARQISAEDHIEISKRSHVEVDDILFSMIGGNIGNQVIVKDSREFSIKNVALFKYYDKKITAPYYFKIYTENLASVLQESAKGGAQPFISLGALRKLVFALPPIEEQHRIVAKADELMALCDQLKARLTDAQTTKLHLTDAIVEQAL